MKKQLKNWIDCNVHDGQDRSGCVKDWVKFNPDELQELIDDMYEAEVEPKIKDLERRLEEVMAGLTLIESSLINLRPRDKSPIDRRFGDLIKDIVQLKEKG